MLVKVDFWFEPHMATVVGQIFFEDLCPFFLNPRFLCSILC